MFVLFTYSTEFVNNNALFVLKALLSFNRMYLNKFQVYPGNFIDYSVNRKSESILLSWVVGFEVGR